MIKRKRPGYLPAFSVLNPFQEWEMFRLSRNVRVPIPRKGNIFCIVAFHLFCITSSEGLQRYAPRDSLYHSEDSPVPSQKGMDMLEVRETTFSNTTLFVLTGQFVYHSTARVETLIVGAQELGHKQIILDFSGVTGIDSIALMQLYLWYHKLQPHQIDISIVNPQPRIREVLEQSHINNLIPINSSNSDLEAV